LRDATVISLLQLAVLFLLGVWLLWEFRVRVQPGNELLLAVLLCLFSCVFLYHRIYDSVILALPLLYCVDRVRERQAGSAIVYKAIATGLVLVLNLPRGGLLIRFSDWSQSGGLIGRLIQVFLLPYCTWILLASLFLLWYLGRQPRGSKVSEEVLVARGRSDPGINAGNLSALHQGNRSTTAMRASGRASGLAWPSAGMMFRFA
jgi:hypothetical protein